MMSDKQPQASAKPARLFDLDWVRAIATALIVLTHFNANFLGWNGPAQPEKCVLTCYPFGIYVGDLGVGMFVILSGAALQLTYGPKRIAYWAFLRKRLFRLLPVFWLAWFAATVFFYWRHGVLPPSWWELNPVYFLATVFQVDGFMAGIGLRSFYLVGEWFIGLVLLLYFIFPALKWALDRFPRTLPVVVLVPYIVLQAGLLDSVDPVALKFLRLTVSWLPLFVFGMYWQKHAARVNLPVLAGSLVVLAANTVLTPAAVPIQVQQAYVSVACYLALSFLGQHIGVLPARLKTPVVNATVVLSAYSYEVFLVHHFVENQLMEGRDLTLMSHGGAYVMFAVCVTFVALAAWGLKRAYANITGLFAARQEA
jgi:peptidoglycan/LPS O-acetylase OafA/YrhL